MIKECLFPGVTRIRLGMEHTAGFEPIVFADEGGIYLAQTGFTTEPRPVFRMAPQGDDGSIRQTANGEVVVFDDGNKSLLRMSHSAVLTFSCSAGEVLTGLGQHENGIFDYARKEERLYQHNMKIAVPFLLSSAGWGLLIEAGCAMRYIGKGNGFIFTLDAAEEVSYVVIRKENCAEVLKSLSLLTGRPSLLPKWAFGYMQSRERYKTAEELINTAAEFRRRGIGLDCIVLDWCSWREGCWGDKAPDPERFPDIHGMIDTLHGKNVHFMVSVWPNTASGQDCEEFLSAGQYLPGTRIYDAFNPDARDLYWKQCRRHWMDGGADALWCDSCEPITDPDWCGDAKRDEDERMRLLTDASALRMDPERMNNYGAVHVRGLYEHWRQDYPEKRPVILARSGGLDSGAAGTILWSGDVAARWEVLRKQVTEAIRTACSGICWWTLDIGAFFVNKGRQWFWDGAFPDGVRDPGYRELYIRWFQFGAMLPVFRSHGTDTPREPWQFGEEGSKEYTCIRNMIGLRYRLLPYLYSTAAQACREGLPMIRAMLTSFPEEKRLFPANDQYMLGDVLLVKPVTCSLADGGNKTEVLLPSGGWFDLFSKLYYSGGRKISVPTPIDSFPVFVRAGGILPVAQGAQCAADMLLPAREILAFGGSDGETVFYDDDGDGYGASMLIPMAYSDREETLTLGEAAGRLPEPVCITVRLYRPDGRTVSKETVYDGYRKMICFR